MKITKKSSAHFEQLLSRWSSLGIDDENVFQEAMECSRPEFIHTLHHHFMSIVY